MKIIDLDDLEGQHCNSSCI